MENSDETHCGYWLEEATDEYQSVKYRLKLSLRGRGVRDISVWKIDNPYLNLAFEQRRRQQQQQQQQGGGRTAMLSLECWYDVMDLSDDNPLQQVCQRGFIMPSGCDGLSFVHGNITLNGDDGGEAVELTKDSNDPSAAGEQHQIYHLHLLCSVVVGRPLVVDLKESQSWHLPAEYDSFHIASQQQHEETKDGHAHYHCSSDYRYEYIVQDPAQVLPRYVVRFLTGVVKDDDEEEQASKPAQAVDDDDPLKLYDRYDFFDAILFTPVSLRDKMTGSHSTGEAATHKLVSIKDAYKTAMAESGKQDPVLAAKRADIERQLLQLDDKLKEVNNNVSSVEKQLIQTMQEAMATLQSQTMKKMKLLMSTEGELRRELEEIEWTESYLEIARKEKRTCFLPFLTTWKYHTAFRSQLCHQVVRETDVLESIQPDLEVNGKVEIVSRRRGDSLLLSSLSTSGPAPQQQKHSLVGEERLSSATTFQDSILADGLLVANALSSPAMPSALGLSNVNKPNPPLPPSLMAKLSIAGAPYSLNLETDTVMTTSTSRQALPPPPPSSSATTILSSNTSTAPAAPLSSTHASTITTTTCRLSPSDLLPIVQQYKQQYSLQALANRRKRQTKTAFTPRQSDMFSDSTILTPSDAALLYYCLPSIASIPTTTLIYSSTPHHAPSLNALQTALSNTVAPTLLIIRSGQFTFGGYSAEPWRIDGVPFGGSKCFLFSLTLDLKIPYHGGRRQSQVKKTDEVGEEEDGSTQEGFLSAGPGYLQFGPGDLCLRGDLLTESTTELEHSYGVGLAPEGEYAQALLAGAPVFAVDQIEVWAIH